MTHPTGGLAAMHPASFALVMATGIVSIACGLTGLERLAEALLVVNLGGYPILWGLLIARIVRYRELVLHDLRQHDRAVGFFTIVAATGVLGSQVLLVADAPRAATALWIAGIVLWLILTYGIVALLAVQRDKPPLADAVHGGWLLLVVATQSVSLLGAQLAPRFGDDAATVALGSLVLWLGGGLLYLWIGALVCYRLVFLPLAPAALTPPYWITMGAAAISTVGGAMLVGAAPAAPVVAQVLPFVRGLTLLWWAAASWWIPLLLVLGVWRHGVRRVPLRYEPRYWSAVFPLGMYAVASQRLSTAVDAAALTTLARGVALVALAAWTLALVGMIASLVEQARLAR